MTAPYPHDWLAHRARFRPDVPALADEHGERLSYSELAAQVAPLAAALPAAEPGAHVAIELEPGLEHARAMHAAIAAGVPFATVRPGLPSGEREAALGGGSAAVIDVGWLERARGEHAGASLPEARPEPGRVLCRVRTSGTSGSSRAVELTHGNHLWSATASAFNLGVDPSELWLCCLPLDHVAGLAIPIRSAILGTTALIHSCFDPERVADALARERVSLVSLVPTQLRRLIDIDAPLDRPRALLLGAAPLSEELRSEASERGATVLTSYGLTEACSQVSTLSPADVAEGAGAGSSGRPLLGVGVEIEDGEIVVSGPSVAPGAADEQGRLRTGDLGRLDERGYLHVEGRRDDLIVSGGENVMPEEVEAVLRLHPAVLEAAVVGREDREWGAAVTAVVVCEPGREAEAEALRTHCRAMLAPFKVPKSIEFASRLPRTGSGKLLRSLLR